MITKKVIKDTWHERLTLKEYFKSTWDTEEIKTAKLLKKKSEKTLHIKEYSDVAKAVRRKVSHSF